MLFFSSILEKFQQLPLQIFFSIPCILFCYLLDLHEVIRCVLGSLLTLLVCSSETNSLVGDIDTFLLSGLTEVK